MITLEDRRNVYRATRRLGFPPVTLVDGAGVAGELAWLVLCRAGKERWIVHAVASLALARPAGAETTGGGDAP